MHDPNNPDEDTSSISDNDLRHEATLHVGSEVSRISWSPDGASLAIGTSTGRVSVFAPPDYAQVHSWQAHGDKWVRDLGWHPDGTKLATCGDDGSVALWQWPSGQLSRRVNLEGGWVLRLAWSPDGRYLAVAPHEGAMQVFDDNLVNDGQHRVTNSPTAGIAWAPDSSRLAYCTDEGLALYHMGSKATIEAVRLEATDSSRNPKLIAIAWSPDGGSIVTGGYSTDLLLVSTQSSALPTIMEGPDSTIFNVQFSPDGRLIVVRGSSTVAIWRSNPWELIKTMNMNTTEARSGLVFRPDGSLLAISKSKSAQVLRLDTERLLRAAGEESAFYVTAKIALLGESGVGKTSLACRIVSNEFQQHPSTHGQQFWVVPELAGTRADGAMCEAILWDFAGQADYRLVHALLLDDVDVALLLFDPGNVSEPLQGVKYWLRQLYRESTDIRTILVGARVDRAAIASSTVEVDEFCRENKISGGYLGTSSATGEGIEALVQRVRNITGWENIAPTITTVTFKKIKEFILQLKSGAEPSGVIKSADELMTRLRELMPKQGFREKEIATAVAQLAKHGLVTSLRNAQGTEYVLLAPDLLTSLASSVVLEARRDPMELGTIDEKQLLTDQIAFPELTNLRPDERAVLLDSVVTLFVRHALCFREFVAGRSLLLFPALINLRIAAADRVETEEGATYIINGATENIYAALVVLLGYTNTFTRRSQWRDQAEYEMDQGELCGFRLVHEADGELEIVLYYGLATNQPSRQLFQSQVERIISRRRAAFTRFGPVRCTESSCGYIQDRGEVRRRVLEGRKYVFCSECGIRIPLIGIAEYSTSLQTASSVVDANEKEAYRRTRYEEGMVRLKALLRDRGQDATPSCFVSYAWGDAQHERQVRRLKDDLVKAGLTVLFDRTMNEAIGSSIGRFVASLDRCDYVIVIGTPEYVHKYENRSAHGSVVAAEMDVIFNRLLAREEDKRTVLPALMDGTPDISFPAPLRRRVYASIVGDEDYFSGILDLILTMYDVPFGDPGVEQIRSTITGSLYEGPSSIIG